LPGLRNFLAQSLGLEAEAIEGFHSLPDASALNAPLFRENVLSFGVAFGLAIQGLGLATIQTSLLPPEILSQKIMRKKRPFFVGAAACLVAAIGCFGYDQIKGFGELAGQPGEVDRIERDVGQMAGENTAKQALFEKEKQSLVERQTKLAEVEAVASDPAYAYELARAVWEALPYDEKWRTYDPAKNSPPRTDLRIVELLDLRAQYVADVRPYSGSASAGLDDIEAIEAGTAPAATASAASPAAPAEGESAPAAPKRTRGPRPGILVRIVGITPKPARDGHQFVNDELIEKLKNAPQTVRLRTLAGDEILAKVRLTGRFGDQKEFADFSSTRSEARGAAGAPAGSQTVEIDRRNDFWFVAEWVVKMPGQGMAPAAPAGNVAEKEPL
jgi:type IV pilus assembly protein PilM